MLKIGLTGGIGSGKSTVASYFEDLGIQIIDSDVIARNLTNIAEPAHTAIVQKYGNKILTQEGEINRRELRAIIFSDTNEKRWLEDLIHPLIKQKILEGIAASTSPYCIVVIPLLVETGVYDLTDRILVVDSPIEKQISRTTKRDKTSEHFVIDIIKNQATREERMAVATDVIYNNGDFDQLKQGVYQQHLIYLQMLKS
ncbi:MAG: dephospho-CoA kinase [Gammaproteobacteria bacterium]|nr:dephospho-CoA kinase [Gammaproteobacteria bacterium]